MNNKLQYFRFIFDKKYFIVTFLFILTYFYYDFNTIFVDFQRVTANLLKR